MCGEWVRVSRTHGLAYCRLSLLVDTTQSPTSPNVRWRQLESPPILKQTSLSRNEGKRPDSLTMVAPWCKTSPVQTHIVSSHLNGDVLGPCAVANEPEEKKSKYGPTAVYLHCTSSQRPQSRLLALLATRLQTFFGIELVNLPTTDFFFYTKPCHSNTRTWL